MKVLYVDQTGQFGGGELSLLDIVKHSSGHAEVALFTDGPFRHALEQIPVPVHLLSLGQVADVRREAKLLGVLRTVPALLSLRRELMQRARGFDVLYANSQKAFLVSALARKKRQILIWHLRDMLTAAHFSPLLRRVAVFAGNHCASAVIANSEATRDSFIQAGGRPDKIFVVHNGIDPATFDSIEESEVAALRKELGFGDQFILGCFGRISPWKAQHIVIEALKLLPDCHAMIVGEALFGEQAYSDHLHELARSLGVEQRVHFVGFRRDIPVLMKLSNVVVHSSIAPEPFGRVIVEAMLARTPVIATRAGGAVEIVVDRQTGLLVEPGSVEALAEAVSKIKNDRNFGLQVVSAGRKRATEVFSINAMIEAIQKVITNTRE